MNKIKTWICVSDSIDFVERNISLQFNVSIFHLLLEKKNESICYTKRKIRFYMSNLMLELWKEI